MLLTIRLLEQITGVGGFRADPFGREQRHSLRVSYSAHAVIACVQNGHIGVPQPARCRDISRSGISLLFKEAMGSGDQFLLQLVTKKQQPLWLRCRTARCKSAGEHLFIIGAQFTGFLFAQDEIVFSEDISEGSSPSEAAS